MIIRRVTVNDLEPTQNGLKVICCPDFNYRDYLFFGPLAPAYLLEDDVRARVVCEIHRSLPDQGDRLVLEQFHAFDQRAPEIGKTYLWQGWWVPNCIEMILAGQAGWAWRVYPDNGDHDHCQFTGEAIAAYTEIKDGYHSADYGWITRQAFQDYLRDDIYKIREYGR